MMRLHTRALVPALAACALTGCTTTYVGHKLPVNGELPEGKVSGIPFTMTRPEFSVDIAPDANDPTKAVYTLKSSDVPDPTQRYTIALDPALLVDGTFELAFGEQDNLSGATATSTSRVVATLESVVSFAINKAAPGVAKDMSSALGQYRTTLRGSAATECTKAWTGGAGDVKTEIDRVIGQLVAEASVGLKDSDDDKAKAHSLAASRFHYADLAQKACLVAVVPAASSAISVTSTKDKYETALKQANAAVSEKDVLSREWLKNLEDAVGGLDARRVDKLEKANVPTNVKAVTGSAKAFINTSLSAKRLKLMAEQFAFMTQDVWRSRHLQSLERQLKQLRLERLLAKKGSDTATQLDADIRRLTDEWAMTLGEPQIVQRIEKLDAFLAEVRVIPGGAGTGPRYAAVEHVQLREERDKLQERVDRLRNELVAKDSVIDAEPEKKKVEPRTDVRVQLVGPQFIQKVAASPGTTTDLPEFVLVVKRMDEPTVRPDPVVPAKVEAKQ